MSDRRFNAIAETRYGPFIYNRHDRFVGRSVERYGECCELELVLLRQLCSAGDTIFDIGANIGTHTVPLAIHVGETGFVYAFEPQRVIFQTLCGNVALRSQLNVECVHAALGERHDALVIPDIDYNAPANYGGVSPLQFAAGRPVAQLCLDDYLWLPRVQLVKIDVEGMELAVLRGGRRFVEAFRPFLYVENDRLEKSAELIRAIHDLRYRAYWHLAPLFNPGNFRNVRDDEFPNIVAVNMLCVPAERNLAIEGFAEILDPGEHPVRRPSA